ncbi:MAG TPA: hypothetical protein VOA80_12855, partial [Thermoanaerobaculia bacterium]|nr:hypothetical protein [Thermoanaerobaculia bacterium]
MSLEAASSGSTRDTAEVRKRICGELAELLSTPQGLEQARLLQASGLLGQPPDGQRGGKLPPSQGQPKDNPYPRPILDFVPVREGEAWHFARPDGMRLEPRRSVLPHRICLLGESAAAGMFYRPRVTPASILARQLAETAGPRQFEVIDLALPALTEQGLVEVAVASLQLNPSLLVVFAGNNWVWSGLGPDLGSRAAGRLTDFQDAATALEERGVPGLKDLAERRVRERAIRHVDLLARLAGLAKVPLVWVVPEVNLPDVDVPHPVYWLTGDGVRTWYRAYDRAMSRLAAGEYEAAALAGERLIALDGGACAASQGLLAKALWGLGRRESACAAFRAQVDAASWNHQFRRASGVSNAVMAVLRDSCQRLGVTRVDLPDVFDLYCRPALPDRRMFLDHCHLTLEGMTVAMAAVAAAVVGRLSEAGTNTLDWQDLARAAKAPGIPAAVAGLAQLQAGLYNSNLDYQDRERIEELFASALEACPELREALQDYVLARAAPCHPWLTAACRRNRASAYELDARVWERWDLGGDLLERLCSLLSRYGCDVERQVIAPWIEQNDIPHEGV